MFTLFWYNNNLKKISISNAQIYQDWHVPIRKRGTLSRSAREYISHDEALNPTYGCEASSQRYHQRVDVQVFLFRWGSPIAASGHYCGPSACLTHHFAQKHRRGKASDIIMALQLYSRHATHHLVQALLIIRMTTTCTQPTLPCPGDILKSTFPKILFKIMIIKICN